MSQENYKGQYAGLKFPPYEYQEYPKYIRDGEGKVLGIAASAREEREILSGAGVVAKVDPLVAERDAAIDELLKLREKLAKYEGDAGTKQVAAPVKLNKGPQTQTVEMLPAEPAGVAASPTAGPAAGSKLDQLLHPGV